MHEKGDANQKVDPGWPFTVEKRQIFGLETSVVSEVKTKKIRIIKMTGEVTLCITKDEEDNWVVYSLYAKLGNPPFDIASILASNESSNKVSPPLQKRLDRLGQELKRRSP